MYLTIAPIFVLKSVAIYILSCLEHEGTNICVISYCKEIGGIFGERVFRCGI